MKKFFITCFVSVLISLSLSADVTLTSLYSDNAVIQRHAPVKIWGWASPSEKVTVTFVGKKLATKTDSKGNWSVVFPAQKAGGPHSMTVTGKNTIQRKNLLFGEVWVCSGQSNMQMNVGQAVDGDIEVLLAKDTDLRVLTVTNAGEQTPQKDVDGGWEMATGGQLKNFSAVGYYYGRELRRALGVPVGLIDNSWGGSSCETWIPQDVLKSDKRNQPYIETFAKKLAKFEKSDLTQHDQKRKALQERIKKAKSSGKIPPSPPTAMRDIRHGQHRPGNLWNARINPLLGYGIKGVIWYQGENNTRTESYIYRYTLPMMIKTWRKNWNSGEFSFYWSQLANYSRNRDKNGASPWAEIRESMTLTMQSTPKTGQAIITDLGEDKDIHPRKKLQIAKRLVRWALVKDYGFKLTYSSPMYKSHETKGNKIIVTLDQEVKTIDVRDVLGFTIAGDDQKFVKAQAKINKNKVEIWSDSISKPAAIRYAWAGNPVSNVINKTDLPLTPFRTDKWKLSSE
ncbi:MAG: sialate O-acetylesterase [Lentisphaeraceae bacterium]|nr:sialate O-acetylesterase [Lentisphaeraceae bacterium]